MRQFVGCAGLPGPVICAQHAVRRAKGYVVQLTNAISLTYEAVLVSAAALLITVLVLISFPVGAVSG